MGEQENWAGGEEEETHEGRSREDKMETQINGELEDKQLTGRSRWGRTMTGQKWEENRRVISGNT